MLITRRLFDRSAGDVARFMPIENGGCTGAAAADAGVHGGELDSTMSVSLALPHGEQSGVYGAPRSHAPRCAGTLGRA